MSERLHQQTIAAVEANIRQAKIMLSMLKDDLEADLVPDELRLLIKANQKLLRALKAGGSRQ